jgi:hypothetical protein
MLAKSILPCLILLGGFLEGVATGQSGNGYVNFGCGSISNTYLTPNAAKSEVAIGGEVAAAQTVGFGGEVGYAGWGRNEVVGFGLVSLDASIYLTRHAATGKVDPFISGGYTRAINLFSIVNAAKIVNGANFGFGLNYWLTHHFGVRAEFRDAVFPGGSTTTNFWVIRGGIAFR